MSNYNNFSKMFHAHCKIPNIVRKIFFRNNLIIMPITIGKKMFSINLQSLFDSRSIYFGDLQQSSRCANHSGSNRGLTWRRGAVHSKPILRGIIIPLSSSRSSAQWFLAISNDSRWFFWIWIENHWFFQWTAPRSTRWQL